jgi:hypothetical protein
LGFRVWSWGFLVPCLKFGVSCVVPLVSGVGFGFRVSGIGYRVSGFGLRFVGSGFLVEDLGLEVKGS